MLLPFLLKKNKVWRQCKLRIFAVAQEEDNSIQMKKDLQQFLYQARITAQVFIIELPDVDISPYTYDRTFLMEEKQHMLEEIKLSRRERRRSYVQNVVDSSQRKGSLLSALASKDIAYRPSWSSVLSSRFSQSPSTSNLDSPEYQTPPQVAKASPRFEIHPADESNPTSLLVSPSSDAVSKEKLIAFQSLDPVAIPEPTPHNLRHMNTSVHLNELIIEKSHNAELVVINLPSPPENHLEESSYMAFLEVLTEGIERVLMVRGGGREVFSIS